MDLKIVNLSNNELPEYKTAEAAGMDLRAWLPEGPIILQPMERRIIPTGLHSTISFADNCTPRQTSLSSIIFNECFEDCEAIW